jgi:hypothetical protein
MIRVTNDVWFFGISGMVASCIAISPDVLGIKDNGEVAKSETFQMPLLNDHTADGKDFLEIVLNGDLLQGLQG